MGFGLYFSHPDERVRKTMEMSEKNDNFECFIQSLSMGCKYSSFITLSLENYSGFFNARMEHKIKNS
jgi:hypothetical protein